MSEWWTYNLSDFLLFSARTYFRLFEIYNAAIWPAQLAALAIGIAILVLLRRGGSKAGQAIGVLLAACWIWTAIFFLAARYATINWAAVYFAWAFGLEGALLVWFFLRGRLSIGPPETAEAWIGLAVLVFALALQPLIGPALGRGWRGAQTFGVTPDPTAVATLGIVLLSRGRRRGVLMTIPLLWCGITGATLLAMKQPDAWIPFAAAALSLAGAISSRTKKKR
jgi:hypothetical protein